MVQFEWPLAFLLIPLPLITYISRSSQATQGIKIPLMLYQSLNTLNIKTNTHKLIQHSLLWAAWLLLTMAIAQPWIAGDSSIHPATGRAVAIAVDLSGSMERKDLSIGGQSLTRLAVVKQLGSEFIQHRQGDRLSLVLYGKQAFIASPLTFDLASLVNLLNSAGIGMAGRSTAIGDALGLSINTLREDPATQKAIVLLSDGTNNSGSVEPESAAQLASELGIRVHTIALGSRDTQAGGYQLAPSADLDEQTLQEIASIAGGSFFRAASYKDLEDVYSAINQLESASVDAPPVVLKKDLRHWPLYGLIVVLLLISLRQQGFLF